MTTPTDILKRHALLALQAALEAGFEILEVYGRSFEVEHKADSTPLTEADMRAHRRILALLERYGERDCGELPVLSEEASEIPYDRRELWERYWLVDPLDGTKEFVKRNGEFTVNIAYLERGAPRAGVVYAPVLKRAYVGVAGEGAYRVDHVPGLDPASGDEAPRTGVESAHAGAPHASAEARPGQLAAGVPVSWADLIASATPLPDSERAQRPFTVVASRSHMSPETERFIEELREEHPAVELISAGSALKMCLVAEGAADLYPRFAPTMEWDTAAGHAVCLAAGVEVSSWPAGRPLEYNKPDLVNPWFLVRRP